MAENQAPPGGPTDTQGALVACRELRKQRSTWYWKTCCQASVRTAVTALPGLGQHMQRVFIPTHVPGNTCPPRQHSPGRSGCHQSLPKEQPPSESSLPPKATADRSGGGPPAPRISTVPDPWVPEPAPTPGSQVGENTGWTLGRGCGVPLSAINSLEFTLALYIITRLFTAF